MQSSLDTAAVFFAGVKNCTDSVHKFSRAFLLCYESVQFLTPAKQLAAVSPYRNQLKKCKSPVQRGSDLNLIFTQVYIAFLYIPS
jgi:hypothetical protein